jgi:DNA-binding transcriptional LysR family regulator
MCAASTPTATTTFRVAASDYLDPLFLPQLVAQIKARRRCARSRSTRCRPRPTTTPSWPRATVDVVVGNWLKPPEDLHMGACLATRWCAWCQPTTPPCAAAGRGELAGLRAHRPHAHPPRRPRRDRRPPGKPGPARNITARCPHFGLIPAMVASSLLVLTTGRQYCERFTRPAAGENPPMPGAVSAPHLLPALARAQPCVGISGRWLRERIKSVAARLLGILQGPARETTA